MELSVGGPKLRERARVEPTSLALLALVALAALLRFATISDQSYWFDESLTVGLTRLNFGARALGISDQAEPPLYFALAWVWTRLFGDGEAGLRSLSAVFGILTVPVAYSAARSLVSRRAGLVAAAVVAVSPALITYSQEARAYALYFLLCALSVMLVAWIRERPTARNYALWAAVSALAVLAHYFAIFLVLPEAAWLVWRSGERRRAYAAAVGLGAALAAIAPIALYQRSHGSAEWISNTPLRDRLRDAGHFLLIGPAPSTWAAVALSVAFVAAGVLVWTRSEGRPREGALLALAAGAAVIALPVAGAAVGSDYVLDRNLLAALVPLVVLLAAGLTVPALRWAGPAVALAICAGLVVEQVKINRDENLHRDDWRSVARTIGPPDRGRLVDVLPGWQEKPLALYRPALRLSPRPRWAREVVQVRYDGPRPRPGPTVLAPPPPPFRAVRVIQVQRMTITRFRAPRPALVKPPPPPQAPWSDGPVAYVESP
jgi:mannosyltransferase